MPLDAERVRAVRKARPDAWMGVDANQGFDAASLTALMPDLVACKVKLVEQPFARGRESELDGFRCPIPIAADESVQGLADIEPLVGRFDIVNIKLDKCGGLTEGLAMVAEARRHGLGVMVGNMVGTQPGDGARLDPRPALRHQRPRRHALHRARPRGRDGVRERQGRPIRTGAGARSLSAIALN